MLVASGAEGDPPHLSPLAFNVVATKPDTCEKRKSLCEKMGRAFAEAMAFIRSDAKGTLAILKKTFANFDDAVLADAIEVVRQVDAGVAGGDRRGAGERRELQRRGAADEGRRRS